MLSRLTFICVRVGEVEPPGRNPDGEVEPPTEFMVCKIPSQSHVRNQNAKIPHAQPPGSEVLRTPHCIGPGALSEASEKELEVQPTIGYYTTFWNAAYRYYRDGERVCPTPETLPTAYEEPFL